MREHFSTDAVPPRDRAQFGLDLLAEKIARLTPGGRPDQAMFRAELDLSIVGRFTTFHFETSHLTWRRTPADLRVCSSDMFSLLRAPRERFYLAGPMRSNNVEIRLGAGDFCISSNMWPYQSEEKESFSVGGLLIPHGVLSPLLAGGRFTRPVPVPAGSPLGSVLGAAFDAAITQVPALPPELGDAVLLNLCGLVALACGASEEGRSSGRESLRAARFEAAKRYIEQHLAEPGLTPASTAAALGISLRHLHLLFEPTGNSFAQYVARQRLLQCRAALTRPIGVPRSVTDIAFGWGFNSLATFYRAFEREFGLPPASLRAATAAGLADRPDVSCAPPILPKGALRTTRGSGCNTVPVEAPRTPIASAYAEVDGRYPVSLSKLKDGKFSPHAAREAGQRCGSISRPTIFRRATASSSGSTSWPSRD